MSKINGIPHEDEFCLWTGALLENQEVSVTIRVVDEPEMIELNNKYRGNNKRTNVLAFPFQDPPGQKTGILGDIVICAPVVEQEAEAGGLTSKSHWAHMIVHGIMHLQGYDHDSDKKAREMEDQETHVLSSLGFPSPYSHI